ncbi:MAG: L-threonylcarbamoyladenylate synthase [Burkholderiales bacterium]
MQLDAANPASIQTAARELAAGNLVAVPTETVYGLAADAGNDAAVGKIFAAKGRPADHPLIVHVADRGAAREFTGEEWPVFAEKLAAALWPGPLTLILPRRENVATAAAANLGSIGLRCPSHPAARALLAACAELGVMGLAAPSANRFGRISPTSAEHVAAELGDELLVLDGGHCAIGIESAIVDCTRGAPVLLRPGQLSRAQLEAAAGLSLHLAGELDSADPQAPGTLATHYAPRAKLRLMNAKALQTALDLLGADLEKTEARIAVYARAPLKVRSTHILQRRMPQDAAATAQQLFSVLREFDSRGASLIWVESPPDAPEWDGVRDRLERAAA